MNLAKLTLASTAALMMGASVASADMILRQDANNNWMMIDTETETEQAIYSQSPDNTRPADCDGGGFYEMMDGDNTVYVSCDDDTVMYSGGADMKEKMSASGDSKEDLALEPYAPATKGTDG